MRIIFALSCFQLAILITYGISCYLAFHPNQSKALEESEKGLSNLFNWLNEATLLGFLKKMLVIALFMSAVLLFIYNLPQIPIKSNSTVTSISPFKFLIIFNTLVASATLSQYLADIFHLEQVPKFRIFLNIVIFALTNAWIMFPNWLTIDAAALAMGVMLLVQFRSISFRGTILLSFAVMLYDAIAVFGTRIMQKAAGGFMELPILLKVPSSLALSAQPIIHIGLGDIVLPGVIVMMAMRESRNNSKSSLFTAAMVGYVVGFIITILVMAIFQFPQPATIYLMPCTLLCFIYSAWKNNILKNIC